MSQFEGTLEDDKMTNDHFTITLLNDDNSQDDINDICAENLKNIPSNIDCRYKNLIDDIHYDDTFSIVKLDNNFLKMDTNNTVNNIYDFNHIVTDIQRNTNFNKHENHLSASYSKNYSLDCLDYGEVCENVGNLPGFPDNQCELVKQHSHNDLFEKFSRRSSKVAIKSEVKILIKHFAKRIMKEFHYKKEREMRKQDQALKRFMSKIGPPNDSDNIHGTESLNEVIEKNMIANIIADNVMVIDSNNYDNGEVDDAVDKEIQDLFQNYGSMTIDLNTATPSNTISDSHTDMACYSKNHDLTPPLNHRAIATSPINIPGKQDDVNKRFSGLLNCMSGQDEESELQIKNTITKQKIKSSSRSIFHRLFSKDKYDSRNSSCRETPAYFTTIYPKIEKSNSLLDKCQSNTSSPITFHGNEPRNDWLEIEQPVKPMGQNTSFDYVQRASSCQGTMKMLSKSYLPISIPKIDSYSKIGNLDKTTDSDNSRNSGAVFIID